MCIDITIYEYWGTIKNVPQLGTKLGTSYHITYGHPNIKSENLENFLLLVGFRGQGVKNLCFYLNKYLF